MKLSSIVISYAIFKVENHLFISNIFFKCNFTLFTFKHNFIHSSVSTIIYAFTKPIIVCLYCSNSISIVLKNDLDRLTIILCFSLTENKINPSGPLDLQNLYCCFLAQSLLQTKTFLYSIICIIMCSYYVLTSHH